MTVTYTHKDPKDFYLKTITDVQIDWNSESGLNKEGAGDQKVHITYSTGEDEVVGAPINYIMEAVKHDEHKALLECKSEAEQILKEIDSVMIKKDT